MKLSRRTAQMGLIATIAILVLGMTVVFVGSTEGRTQPTPQSDSAHISAHQQ
jgi:hypothetical protein